MLVRKLKLLEGKGRTSKRTNESLRQQMRGLMQYGAGVPQPHSSHSTSGKQ